MKALVWLALLSAGLGGIKSAGADTPKPGDSLEWLNRVATSARQLTYSGTFVYQYGKTLETSRITHMRDAGGERSKLETLDGPLQVILRRDDDFYCLDTDSKPVRLDRSHGRQFFPSLISAPVSAFTDNYQVKLGGVERVAGYDCQVLRLVPKDNMRYERRLCADVGSGLLLKTATFNEKNEMVEMFAFTQVALGQQLDRERVRNMLVDSLGGPAADHSTPDGNVAESGWMVANPPPGFKKVMEMKRSLNGKPGSVYHLVYSDGLAAVSVFIEPSKEKSKFPIGSSQQGAVSYFLTRVADFHVTVVGEVPQASVMQIGNSVALRPR